jgi:protein-tyrosine phosphatase
VNDVFWIEQNSKRLPGQLAIVMRPRGDQWLHADLLRLKQAGIQTLVSMLESLEAESLGLSRERIASEGIGLRFLFYPIPDRSTPSDRVSFDAFVNGLALRLQEGERIGVHCRGCIGRSTIVTACTMIKLGWNPKAALRAIQDARGCAVPDTDAQRDWILRYEASK